MKKNNVKIMLVIVSLIALISVACKPKENIKLGFVSQLTGTQAELGVQERNGAQIAIDEINENNGISGQKLELLVQDDFGTKDGAISSVEELINSKVVAIIGHATSSQTIEGLSVAKKTNTLMISPTASSHELSGKDDNFFRIVTSNKIRTEVFADRIFEKRNIENMAIIYDLDNINYSNSYREAFTNRYEKLGGKISKDIGFSTKSQPNFNTIANEVKNLGVKGVLIIANDFDTAMIAQSLINNNVEVKMFSSSWAQTMSLIYNGGKAVEGMEVEVVYPQNSEVEKFKKFQSKYEERFGKSPSFGAVLGYESVYVLKAGIEKSLESKQDLKISLLEGQYKGLIDEFKFDKYGDVERPFYFSLIEDGKFVTVE